MKHPNTVHAHSDLLIADSASMSILGGRIENQDTHFRSDKRRIYIVADGMGGHLAGGTASQMAVSMLAKILGGACDNRTPCLDLLQATIRQTLNEIVQRLQGMVRQQPACDGVGTTLALAVVCHDQLFYCHVGDCRIYLFRNGSLQPLTADESLAQELLEAHLLPAKQVEHHRWRHIVTNSVSSHGLQRQPVLQALQLKPLDRVLLATNGLTEKLPVASIQDLVSQRYTPEASIKHLKSEANRSAVEHNATAILVEFRSTERSN